MDEGLLPPFGEPSGPLLSDDEVIALFLQGGNSGHSGRFHLEDSVLVLRTGLAAAMRIGADTVLVRLDVPAGSEDLKQKVEEVLTNQGLTLLDEETLLATPVVVQRLGYQASRWDLWGRDIDEAFAALRAKAAGDPFGPPIGIDE